MQALYTSQPYLELLQAMTDRDEARASQIVEQQLACTDGAVKARWLIMWAGRLALIMAPDQWGRSWAALDEVLALAPDHPEIRTEALALALGLCMDVERFDPFFPFIRRLGPGAHKLTHTFKVARTIGIMHMRKRNWRRALSWLNQTVDLFQALTPERLATQKKQLFYAYTYRCRTAASLGDFRQAEADLEVSRSMAANFAPGVLDPLNLALAEAEFASRLGRFAEAQTCVQQGVADCHKYQHKITLWSFVTFDLLAARRARAGGNRTAWEHYSNHALSFCQENRLSITEKGVRAFMAGRD